MSIENLRLALDAAVDALVDISGNSADKRSVEVARQCLETIGNLSAHGTFEHYFICVEKELANAIQKHPRFIDYFTFTNCATFEPELHSRRARLKVADKQANVMFFDVLECEVYEALDAYAHGDLAHAAQELAQCAAVCIRGIDWLIGNMEGR